MEKMKAIIKREYLTRVRSKGFIIGTILSPLFMSSFLFIPLLIGRSGGPDKYQIVVLDQNGDAALYESFEKALTPARPRQPRYELTREVVTTEEEVEARVALGVDADVPRRDRVPLEPLLERDRLRGDVLPARHAPEARARDAAAALVVVARVVLRDRDDHRHEPRGEPRELGIAVLLAGADLARGLPVVVHSDEQRPLLGARHGDRVVDRALPGDERRPLPRRARPPHRRDAR